MPERVLLESWKEIASYLKRSAATCQRWEIELGLPVHRMDGTPKARVFAYTDELDLWKAEKLRSAEVAQEAPKELGRGKGRKLLAMAGSVLVLAALAVLAWQFFLPKPVSSQLTKKPTLAILHFANLSGSEGLDWLRIGLPELITTDLFQSKYLDVVGGDRVYGTLKELSLLEPAKYSRDDLLMVAGKIGADRLGYGSIMEAGEDILITFNLQDAQSGDLISSRRVSCRGEEGIPNGIDELTRQIKSDLNLEPGQVAQDPDMDLGTITSRSPEALKYYMEGYKLKLKGDRDLAKPYFERAVAADPEFAMAYRDLGLSPGSKEDWAKNLKKALELSDRVSIRERYIIQGTYYSTIEEDFEKALQAYKKLLEFYPDDYIGNQNIAGLYITLQDWPNALKHRKFLYEKDKNVRSHTVSLAAVYYLMGAYDEAIEVYRYYLDHVAEDYNIRSALFAQYWESGQYQLALEEADRMDAARPDRKSERIFPVYLMGDYAAAENLCKMALQDVKLKRYWGMRDWLQNIYITQGQLEKAKQQIMLALQEEEALGAEAGYHGRFVLHGRLADIYLIEGQLAEALDEAEKAWRVSLEPEAAAKSIGYQWQALTTKAEIFLELRQFDQAEGAARQVQEIIHKFYAGRELMLERGMADYYFISGKIELKRGNSTKAIENLQKALSVEVKPRSIHPSLISALASAYEQAGKLRAARKEYEKIPLLTQGRLLRGYEYATSFYRLGKVCEQMGDRAKGIEYSAKFLDLWKNADRLAPEVEDARARIERLASR